MGKRNGSNGNMTGHPIIDTAANLNPTAGTPTTNTSAKPTPTTSTAADPTFTTNVVSEPENS